MRAITLADFGREPELRQLPEPEPAANQLRVHVHASSVNGADRAIVAGMLQGMMEHEFPVTLGRDFAGVVEQVGSEVGRYAIGDEVYGFLMHADPTVRDGTWADAVVVPEDRNVARKPAKLDMAGAGALPLAGITALLAVDAVAPAEQDVVLVVGATGGVGGFAVQLAARRGATVLATAKPGDEDRVRELGASDTIDYTSRDVAEVVRARHPDGVQGLIDVVSFADAFATMAALVGPGGRAATPLGAADVDTLAARDVTATNVMATPDPALLARLAEHADRGDVVIGIDRVYPLEQAPEALDQFGRGKHGKLGIAVAS
jgi:NADPH2:quinone reductase